MVLYINKFGWKEALLKFVKIIGWYVGSALVTAAGSYVAGYNLLDEKNAYIVGTLMVVNAALAGAGKWLNTNKPEGVVESKVDTTINPVL